MGNSISLFEQIYEFYRNLILKGIIRKGEYLPSVREVAVARKINPNTVVKAYALLIEDKLITPINKKGYLVTYSTLSQKQEYLKETINKLRLQGYSEQEIKDTLKEVFKDDQN